jgi:hypothetical protein
MHRLAMLLSFVLLVDASKARVHPDYAQNVTVYHVNRKNYSGSPINMNTADLRGDMYFDMRTKGLALECGIWYNHSFWSHLDCDNDEVATPVADLAITKLILEVDSRYGTYADCNVDNGMYECSCHTHTQADCPHLTKTDCNDRHIGYGCGWNDTTNSCNKWTCSNTSDSEKNCSENYNTPATCKWSNVTHSCNIFATPAPTPRPYGGLCNSSTVGREDLKLVDWGRHDYPGNLTEIAGWHDNLIKKVGGFW